MHNLNYDTKLTSLPAKDDVKFASSLGITNPYAKINDKILEKQVEVLEDAIRRYERLEDIKKFAGLVLEDVDDITEDELIKAIESENGKKEISIEDSKAIAGLLNNNAFLDDLLNSFDIKDVQ